MPSVLELAIISNKIYDPDCRVVGSWSRSDVFSNDSSGFYAGVFLHTNGNDMVVAFRGTDDLADGVEDLGIFLGRYPNQAVQASVILTSWMNQYGSSRRVFLTGHSLGGGLASLMADTYDLPCVTFNAPGMSRSSIPAWVPVGISNIIATGQAVLTPDPDILHIRAYFDVVSIGTGPRMGIVHNISVTCAASERSYGEIMLAAVFPAYGAARSLVDTGNMVLCQHSMDNVVLALRGNSLYSREVDFSSF